MRPPTAKVVTTKYKSIINDLMSFVDSVCDEQTLSAFLSPIVRVAAPKTKKLTEVQLAALERSCEHLLGKTLTKSLISANAYRIIANWQYIDGGMHIPEWDGSAELSDAVFLGLYKGNFSDSNGQKYKVKIRLKTGLCSGIIHWCFFTSKQLYYFMDHVSGTKSLKCMAEEIAGMEARLKVEAAGGSLKVLSWECTQQQKKHNRELAYARSDISKCVHGRPCNTCPQTAAECPLAVWV